MPVKLPEALGLLLCNKFSMVNNPPRIVLDGLFTSLRCAAFPSTPMAITTYAALFDGRGEGEMRLTCTRLETEEDFYYYGRWCSFVVSGQTIHYPIVIPRMVFPAPGRYAFSLSFDRQQLSTCYCDVKRV